MLTASLIVTGAVLVAGTLWAGVPRLILQHRKRRLLATCRQRRAIAITFDDGPGEALTPRVVERLEQAAVPATFFVLGRSVRRNPGQLELLRERGCELGTHGDEHVHHLWSWPWQGLADTKASWARLRGHGIDAARLPFRPPYGKLNLLSWLFVASHGTPIAMWTHDSCDTRPDIDRGARAFADEVQKDGGGVVLLHDFDRADAESNDGVLQRLEAVLRLRDEGFRFVPVSELLD